MALWRSGDYFALAMNYSAVANHVVNQSVRVYSLVPVSCLNKHKNKNCISAPQISGLFGDSRERLDMEITRTPHGTSLAEHGHTAWRGPRDRR